MGRKILYRALKTILFFVLVMSAILIANFFKIGMSKSIGISLWSELISIIVIVMHVFALLFDLFLSPQKVFKIEAVLIVVFWVYLFSVHFETLPYKSLLIFMATLVSFWSDKMFRGVVDKIK